VALAIAVAGCAHRGADPVADAFPLLNGAATEAVSQWRFHPAMVKGAPIPRWFVLPVKFSMH